MKTSTVILDESRPKVTLTSYCVTEGAPRPALLVLPGGGYHFHAWHEGEPVALEFVSRGFNCFVLTYTLSDEGHFPTPLRDVSAAIVSIRENCAEHNVDPDRLFVLGFSAGGHLAAGIATSWYKDWAKASPDMPIGANKPTGAILCYAAITAEPEWTHECIVNNAGELDVDEISFEKQVGENTVPAFIWANTPDTVVPSMHALLMATEYAKRRIPYELHVYDEGWHGMSLVSPVQDVEFARNRYRSGEWVADADAWMKKLIERLENDKK